MLLKDIEDYIKNSKIKSNEAEIKFELENEKEKKNKGNNQDIYFITCNYIFNICYKEINQDLKLKDENILVNSINSKSKGFLYLIDELSNDDYLVINRENPHIFE